MSLIEVRLRPTTPWRVGHGAGDRERVDVVYHSDALYSAVTHAMKTLGWLDEWLTATARSESDPAARFSSLFPFIGKTRLIAPPKTWWPPANPGRLYTEAAKLIPLEVVRNGIVDESRWVVDGEIGCLIHTGAGSPVQIAVRTSAAVDRLTGVADPHRIACLEFAPNAGWWGVFSVDDRMWETRIKSAFRLLADSGFGGERSRGWGRAAAPEFSDASSLLPAKTNEDASWWLLSVFSPHVSDAVDWSRGEYAATQRGGWTDSHAGVAPKKQVRVIEEGSVLFAASLRGQVVDVAPEGFPHPVYRSGFALAVPAPPEPALRQAQPAAMTEPDVVPDVGIAPPEAPGEIIPPSAPEPAQAETEAAATVDAPNAEPLQAEPLHAQDRSPEASEEPESEPALQPELADQTTLTPDTQPAPESALEEETTAVSDPEIVAEGASPATSGDPEAPASESVLQPEPTDQTSATPDPQPARESEPAEHDATGAAPEEGS